MLPHSKAFEMLRTVLLLSVLLCTMVTLSSSRTFCPRIFFQNIDEKTMPYKMIEGVYVKHIYDYNNESGITWFFITAKKSTDITYLVSLINTRLALLLRFLALVTRQLGLPQEVWTETMCLRDWFDIGFTTTNGASGGAEFNQAALRPWSRQCVSMKISENATLTEFTWTKALPMEGETL